MIDHLKLMLQEEQDILFSDKQVIVEDVVTQDLSTVKEINIKLNLILDKLHMLECEFDKVKSQAQIAEYMEEVLVKISSYFVDTVSGSDKQYIQLAEVARLLGVKYPTLRQQMLTRKNLSKYLVREDRKLFIKQEDLLPLIKLYRPINC